MTSPRDDEAMAFAEMEAMLGGARFDPTHRSPTELRRLGYLAEVAALLHAGGRDLLALAERCHGILVERFGDPERWPPATAVATGRRPIPADPAGDDLARRWRMRDGVDSARFESERGLHPLAVAAAAQRLAADHPSHIGP